MNYVSEQCETTLFLQIELPHKFSKTIKAHSISLSMRLTAQSARALKRC